MIPGPIEVSSAVVAATSIAPPSHLAPQIIEDFGGSLERMRSVWRAGADSQPFIVAGSGTLAMEMAVTNLLEPGDRALVVNTGYFSDRIGEMLRRRGVGVDEVIGDLGDVPSVEAVASVLDDHKAIVATHVDTSTGVRVDAKALAELARDNGVLSIFDGVCATAAERFEMEAWGADVYLTASQKAIGLPAGLALLVASSRAIEARKALRVPPPLSMDFQQWIPVMRAYEERRKAYFSTPATTLISALRVSLDEILDGGMDARFAQHQAAADRFRAAWADMGLQLVPKRQSIAANTLSAIRHPDAPAVVGRIKAHGVVVAGGLHPAIKTEYFRVGHMGHVLTREEDLAKTIEAVRSSI